MMRPNLLAKIFLLLFLLPGLTQADIAVVKEIIVAPKSVNAAANIGSVNSSPNVRMESAKVDLLVGAPDEASRSMGLLKPILVSVKALFTLVNQSGMDLQLTAGFPVSNSEYSTYALTSFRVVTDGEVREVFRRTGGYPRGLEHQYISGELGPEKAKPPVDVDAETVRMFGEQAMGVEYFQNLMVWTELFAPGQRSMVEVNYDILIPLQEARVLVKKEQGSYKGTWPQEANNMPVEFVKSLPFQSYYFFDYYLTSGASWAGTIGSEDISLVFDPWWQDLDFHSTIRQGRFAWSNSTMYPGTPNAAFYQLRDAEPQENIYFAIRPGENNEQMQKDRQRSLPARIGNGPPAE